jgi:hypothetical protein
MTALYETREEWLMSAVDQLRPHFKSKRFAIPKAVRVSCGLPSKGAFNYKKRAIGEAWSSKASGDEHHEIFISPTIAEPAQVLAVLVHELVHVTVGLKAGHRGMFIECGTQVGLEGPWTSTSATDALQTHLKALAKKRGKYPHAELKGMTNGKKKQTTRLIKVGCPLPDGCGYTTRPGSP